MTLNIPYYTRPELHTSVMRGAQEKIAEANRPRGAAAVPSLAHILENHKKVRLLSVQAQARALVSKKPPAVKAKPTKAQVAAQTPTPSVRAKTPKTAPRLSETDQIERTAARLASYVNRPRARPPTPAVAPKTAPRLSEAEIAGDRLAGYVNRRPAELRGPAVATPRATGGEEAEIERAARRIAGSL